MRNNNNNKKIIINQYLLVLVKQLNFSGIYIIWYIKIKVPLDNLVVNI